MRIVIFVGFIIGIFSCNQTNAQALWQYYENSNFEKYSNDNDRVLSDADNENSVVFMGNSITEFWPIKRPEFFANSNYIGRGISGQTSPQMLLRFREDVINLKPKVVVILAGINDIAQNNGFTPIDMIADNIISMTELARCNNIEVVLCSVLPAIDFPWSPGLNPVNKVLRLNAILKRYAEENNLLYVDYHSAMKDEANGLKVPDYTTADDLVHPNEAGYIEMEKLIQPAIDQALISASFSLNPFFADHMVLQQNEKVAIWGKALAGSEVKVSGNWGEVTSTFTDINGNWRLNLQTPKAGGPYQLNLESKGKTIYISDVLIGEVWLASGQSNMSMPLKGWLPSDPIEDSEKEILNAQYPNIRMFNVDLDYAMDEIYSLDGTWEVCNPIAVREFSATAYFFAKRLHLELNVPIGIIHSSWGGTPVEAWISRSQIKTLDDFDDVIAAVEDSSRVQLINDWYAQCKRTEKPIESIEWNYIELNDEHFADPDFKHKDWRSIELPGRLDELNDLDVDGVFWFRKTIELDDVSSNYSFVMGAVDDTDVVFINGNRIGATSYDFNNPRNYSISKSFLKKGENTIAIRVIDTGGPGSISGPIKLTNQKKEAISLQGEWDYIITAEIYRDSIYQFDMEMMNLEERPPIIYPSPYSTPSTLYNAMIHPLVPFNIKGAIWYQGESNVGRALQYEQLFPAMINDWRSQWNSSFPFYFVQIAPFKYNSSGDESLDRSQYLRDAQRKSLALENTGMVVTLDIGNATNIHPANKQDVGSRLAGLALEKDYDKNIVSSGPLYKSHLVKGENIVVEFEHVGSGLMAYDSSLVGFEIAGADKKFVPAFANIIEDKIELFATKISNPMYVRYAWRDTSIATLFNKEGLPASSFTTED